MAVVFTPSLFLSPIVSLPPAPASPHYLPYQAKELRSVADRMVTLAKEGTLQSRREAAAVVRGKDVLQKLFYDLSERYKDRAGGYTRVLPTRTRVGDAAPMAYIEYIDRPDELRRSRPPSIPPPPSEPQAPWVLSSLRRHWAPPAASVPLTPDNASASASAAGEKSGHPPSSS
ncbi:unnamed protein product [Closterium sp. NIES-64]|nr:unnamed protein product [Closterium sp. NIES-64]